MTKKNYCVYMHTLKLDGRKYIGITGLKPNKRWSNGKGYKPQTYFYNAIKKYGWDNFKHEILFEDLTKEQACNKEIALIKLFNTTNPEYGFNLAVGGEYFIPTEATRKKISDSNIKYKITKEDFYHFYIELNYSKKEMAEYLDCSTGTVVEITQRYNIRKGPELTRQNVSKGHIKYNIIKEEVNKLKEQGLSNKEIADYYGCTERTLRDRLNNKKRRKKYE